MRIQGSVFGDLRERLRGAFGHARGEYGGALIEAALTLPILFLLLLGATQFAMIEYQAIEVTNAANAGAQYGTSSPALAKDVTGIRLAATMDAANIAISTPTVSISCICSNGGASTCANTDCASSHIEQILTVQTQATYTAPFRWPGLPTTFTLNGVAVRKVLQ
jgi:Flp pilus assembly protein TadG